MTTLIMVCVLANLANQVGGTLPRAFQFAVSCVVTSPVPAALQLLRRQVTFVDSTGIGLMVRFKKTLKRRDLKLKFTNVSASVRNVIRTTQLEFFLFD